MSLGAAHTLAALLLEDANLRAARLAVDHAQHPDVGDKRRAGEDFAAILLEKEDAVEIYYNASITRWLTATLDLQIINPALKKTLDPSGQRLQDVGTSLLAGLRLYARF